MTTNRPTSRPIRLPFTGDYSLARSVTTARRAAFVTTELHDRGLDLAFCLEESWAPVAVRVSQDTRDVLDAEVLANPRRATHRTIATNIARILALDTDATGLREVARRDAVVAQLLVRFAGLRPVLFPTPYEAAARAIIGHRLGVAQAAAAYQRIASDHGDPLESETGSAHAFPAPAALAQLLGVRGLSDRKVDQLRRLGELATDGRFSTQRLRGMQRSEALEHVTQIPGIGPFSAELILIRGVGDPDTFPLTEPRLHRAMTQAYHLGPDPDEQTLTDLAERWRPYRSWVGLMLRASTDDRTTGSARATDSRVLA